MNQTQASAASTGAGWVRTATVVALVMGVACQFIQHTDPTFPLLYFTVDSALLLATALAWAEVRPMSHLIDEVRGAATVGVVLSGLVFATVIAPATETGTWFQPHDDIWVRTATLLMHGVGPMLAVADFLLHELRPPGSSRRTGLRWCVWPLVYLVAILPFDVTGIGEIPYTFLRIRGADDVLPTLGAFAVLLAVVFVVGSGLVALHRRVHRNRAGAAQPLVTPL